MYEVVDFIYPYPNAVGILKENKNSCLLVLNSEEISSVESLSGYVATLNTPTGKTLIKSIIDSEVRNGVVGVYLSRVKRNEIPRLSRISWSNE